MASPPRTLQNLRFITSDKEGNHHVTDFIAATPSSKLKRWMESAARMTDARDMSPVKKTNEAFTR
jgi:hypothetical protein